MQRCKNWITLNFRLELQNEGCNFNFGVQLWPVLAVIGGVDRGLRIGGSCTMDAGKETYTVLGSVKQNLPTVKLLKESPYLNLW